MEIQRFTETEKMVILSLMKNPEHRDTDIVKAIGMNLFTFNKTKNSLIRKGQLVKYHVPNYSCLGFEILLTSFGSGEGAHFGAGRMLKAHMDALDRSPVNFIFSMMENNQGLVFNILKNYTSLKRLWRMKNLATKILGLKIGNLKHSIFSLRDATIERFFDVQALIEGDMDDPGKIPSLPPENIAQEMGILPWRDFFSYNEDGCIDLDELSLKVLIELVKGPGMKDPGMIKNLDISRYKFHKIKDDLLRMRLIKPFYAASTIHLGYDVLIFGRMRFSPTNDPKKIMEEYKSNIPENLLFALFDGTEGIFIGTYRNLASGSEAISQIRSKMNKLNFLQDEPDIRIFSLPNCIDEMYLTFHNPFLRGIQDMGEEEVTEMLNSIISRSRGSQHHNPQSP